MIFDIFKSDDDDKLDSYLQQNPDVDAIIKPNNSIKEEFLLNSPNLISVAAFYGAVKCFIYLQNRDANMSYVDINGRTVAHFASLGGSSDICDLLDSSGISFEGVDSDGNTSIHYACMSGNLNLVQKLYLRGFDLLLANKNGYKPIHYAAGSKSVDLLDFLVSEGADINEEVDGNTPILLSALENRPDNVSYLIDQKAVVPEFIDKKGENLLIYLAKKGFDKVISVLINKGKLNPNITDGLGWTPLLHACNIGSIETCKILIENGADVNLASKFGFTPTHCAINRGFEDIKNYLISIGGKIHVKTITSDELQKFLKL